MTKRDIFRCIVEHTKEVLCDLYDEFPEINAGTYFANLGASSCDRAQIAAITLESIAMDIPLEQVVEANTLGDMADIIFRREVSV